MVRGAWVSVIASALSVIAVFPRQSGAADAQAVASASPLKTIVLDTFEAEPQGWKYIGGEEFPGAKGSLARDLTVAHGGKGSYKLEADFRGGGAYVGSWKDLDALDAPDVREFRVWVKAHNLGQVGVRVVDATDQCHQKNGGVSLAPTEEWQELVLKVQDLVGGEHWGGANDGKWQGPPKGFGLNIGKDALAKATPAQATLWLDDLSAVVIPPGKPKLLSCELSPTSCRPGFGSRITYRWDAVPMGKDFTAFVHFIGPDGKMAFQGDHEPPVPTRRWSGHVEYANTVITPLEAKDGDYKIVIGLYDRKAADRGWDHQSLLIGEGVVENPTGNPDAKGEYQIGTLKIASDAPLPKLASPTLNLDAYRVTFNEDFKERLSVSGWGPGTRWIAHTPYAGDFGDAGFADPAEGFPFTIQDGILRIEAKKTSNGWRTGLLSSVDPRGEGFSQKFGYFEMRAKLPKGPGTWPAFWLLGVPQLKEPKDKKTITQIEIDVLEQYGVNPYALHTTLHLWGPGSYHWAEGEPFLVTGMTEDFHTYGVMVEEDFTTFYFDGVELRKSKTLKEAKVPLYILVDLALGGGWPVDKTPDPSYMYVDYVRAYAKK